MPATAAGRRQCTPSSWISLSTSPSQTGFTRTLQAKQKPAALMQVGCTDRQLLCSSRSFVAALWASGWGLCCPLACMQAYQQTAKQGSNSPCVHNRSSSFSATCCWVPSYVTLTCLPCSAPLAFDPMLDFGRKLMHSCSIQPSPCCI